MKMTEKKPFQVKSTTVFVVDWSRIGIKKGQNSWTVAQKVVLKALVPCKLDIKGLMVDDIGGSQ